MKKAHLIKILSLLLAMSALLGGCHSRSAQSAAQAAQPEQQETQQQELAEDSELPVQDEAGESPAQTDAPSQEEAQPAEGADSSSDQAEAAEETEETQQATPTGSYTAGRYTQFNQFVEPLRTSQILQQDFSSEQPPSFGGDVWYGLTVYGFDPTLSAYAGMDGNGHFAAETIEGLIMEHFDVTPEQIREGNDAYSADFGTYIEPQGQGGYTPDFGISGADREGDTLVLVVDQYTDRGKIFHTSVLTIQLESEDTTETEDTEETTGAGEETFTSWKYLSNQTIYDNQAAWE